MARVRLNFLYRDRQNAVTSNGSTILLTFLRVTAMIRIGSEAFARDALLDTGAALSVFPESSWRHFAHEVEWFTFPSDQPPATWWNSASGLTGGSYPCRLGRINVALFDFHKNEVRNSPSDRQVRQR